MTSILKYSSILLYALTFVLILWGTHRTTNAKPNFRPVMLILWAAASIAHALHLYPQTFTEHGVNLTFYNALSIVLFIISTIILVLTFVKEKEFLGIFLLPIVIAGIFLTILRPEVTTSSTNLHGLQFHIVTSLFAFSVLTISALQSLILLNQERHIRKLDFGGMTGNLPPLHDSEKFLFQTITVGFILLSVALISGFLFLENMFEQHVAHKTILSILAWIIFAWLLWGRWQFGWRGGTAIRWTLGGFAFLILAYLGSKFVQELILDRVVTVPVT